jgi:hypothetical protein
MKHSLFFVVGLVFALPIITHAQVNYVSELSKNQDLAKRLGLSKLNEAERAEWNRVLAAVYAMGATSSTSSSPSGNTQIDQPTPKVKSEVSGGSVWISRADLDGKDIIMLRNGAIFKVSVGYVGVGIGRDVALIKEGARWSLWVEGKREFRGELLKPPSFGSPVNFRRSSIQSVSSDGGLVSLIDNSVYEIYVVDRIDTSLWLPVSEVIIINNILLINPDDLSSKIIQSNRLK